LKDKDSDDSDKIATIRIHLQAEAANEYCTQVTTKGGRGHLKCNCLRGLRDDDVAGAVEGGADRRAVLMATELESLPAPGLREIKQVELYTKYRPLVPEMYRDELCPTPSDEILKRIAKQKDDKRKSKRSKDN
jgi:hypothetical protein